VENPAFSGEKPGENGGKTADFWGKFFSAESPCGKTPYFFHRFSTGRKWLGTPSQKSFKDFFPNFHRPYYYYL